MIGVHKFRSSDYNLVFLPSDFKWSGDSAPKLPLILERDGSVFEPFLRYFGWSVRFKRVALSSMKAEASILREFKAYIDSRGRQWDDVDDQLLIEWRELLLAEREDAEKKWLDAPKEWPKPIKKSRIHRKLEVVFDFYDKALASNLLENDLVGLHGPITSKQGKEESERRWKCAGFIGRNIVKRPIPDKSAVNAVLTHLRNASENKILCDRDWLIGRVAAEAGLRRHEIATLTTRVLEEALKEEGVHIPEPSDLATARSLGWNPHYSGLDAIATWEQGRQAVLSGLDRLEKSKRVHIFVTIVGKGNVTRSAPFSIDLLRDLITIGVWGTRYEQITRWSIHHPPATIFLSEKTRKGLEAPAIGNLLQEAFAACKVQGSLHRLRAHFATSLAERLWARRFSDNFFKWDQAVENSVLVEVAEALGHSKPDTTCRHYLDLGRINYFMGTKSHLQALRKTVNAMAENHSFIPVSFFEIIANLIEVRGAALEGEGLDAVLSDILKLYVATVPQAARVENANQARNRHRPSLHLVTKNDDV